MSFHQYIKHCKI